MSIDPRWSSVARRAVSEAGAVCRAVQRDIGGVRALLKDDKSPVTVADLASQAVVARTLSRELPSGGLMLIAEEDARAVREQLSRGENALASAIVAAVKPVWADATIDAVLEAIDLGRGQAGAAFWTLDPIDGTKGFLRGEQYAVSLAWVEGSSPVLGVLGCPNLSRDHGRDFGDPDPMGTLYFAEKGQGVREYSLTDPQDSMRIQRTPLAAGARLRMCESVESGHTKHDASAEVMAKLGEPGAPARLDSQAKYAVVARGQADVYLRMPTKKGYVERIWDHAAGALIASEAGLVVSDVRGAPLDFSHGRGLEKNLGVVVAPPEAHPRLIETIRALGLAQPPG